MGGGFFDNMWDPYSGAFAYPRTQPQPRYYRPRAPDYDQRPVFDEQRGRAQRENRFPSKMKVEEPSGRKTVRTIPVTDGSVPVEVKAQPEVAHKVEQKVEQKVEPVVRLESEDAAATKIQAVYRGYAVRRTEPLKHLRVIMKVKEEFEGFKRRLEGKEQRVKICNDKQERLRWTEGIMALLLRLDHLQGVHPDVRVIRKAAAKELLIFQEKIDSMSDVSEENVEDGAVAEVEKSEVCDAVEEGATVVAVDDTNIPAAEAVEEMEVEENVSSVEDVDLEEATQVEAYGTSDTDGDQEAMEQDSAPADESYDREHDSDGIKFTEMSSSKQDVPHEEVIASAVSNCEDRDVSPSDTNGENMVKDADQNCLELGFTQAAAEVPMDLENDASTMAQASDLEEVEVEAKSLHTEPPMDVEGDKEESAGVVDDPVVTSPSTDEIGVPLLKEVELGDSAEKDDSMGNHEQSHDVGRGNETVERLTNEANMSELDTLGNAGDEAHACTSVEERAIDAGAVDPSDGWMIPACLASLEPQCSAKSLRVGQPQISTAGDTNALSDRALLEQLLEENRKLKEVVGKVLHWGKQQNDIIHNLASRIEQLEEHQRQPNMLPGEKINGRKRICNDEGLVGDRERSLRSNGRRKGRQNNKPQLGYLDSEWLSAESDEYF